MDPLGDLIHNATLLLALALVHNLVVACLPRPRLSTQVLDGLLFGLVALAGMLYPMTLEPGVIFDGRSVVLSMAGLFGGPVSAVVAAALAGGYRIWLAGPGVYMGVGTIVTAASFGIVFRQLSRKAGWPVNSVSLFLFGFLLHLLALAWVVALPPEVRTQVLTQIALPFLVVLPILTLVLGLVFRMQEQRIENAAALVRERDRLQRLLETVEAIIQASPVPQLIIDSQDRVLRINPAFERILGYTQKDLPTLELWWPLAYPDPGYRQRIRDLWQQHIAQLEKTHDSSEPAEIRVHCKDGTARLFMAGTETLDPGDSTSPSRFLVTFYDVTDIKRAQAAAEAATQAKMRFLAHMSHEIRTPMNGIIGLSELALRCPLDEQAREYLVQLHESGGHLLAILDDILDQSKIEAGQLRLTPVPFHLGELMAAANALFAPLAKSKGLQLRCEIDPHAPQWLRADAHRLRQVLANLISNAVKFTESGEIVLSVEQLAHAQSRTQLRFCITDSGMGMDQATQARLFKPFAQGADSIAQRFGGTGLGLTISHQLVELMGGTLQVASRPSTGSAFYFALWLEIVPPPALFDAPGKNAPGKNAPEKDARATATDALPTPLQCGGARVLVVEDHPINQRVVADMLRIFGADVTLAGDGEQGLERLAATAFDLVLMDVQMPRMDGLTATHHIRANPAWAELPVIALTAGVTEDEQDRIRAAGMNDLLAKPITLKALSAVLTRWLASAPVSVTDRPREGEATEAPRVKAGAISGEQAHDPSGLELSELQAILAPEEVAELLNIFTTSARELIEQMTAAIAARDWQAARAQTHQLRGVAANTRATTMAEVAARLEAVLNPLLLNPAPNSPAPPPGSEAHAQRQAPADSLTALVEELQQAYAGVLAAIEQRNKGATEQN